MTDLITKIRELVGPENAWNVLLWMIIFSVLFVLACLLVRTNQSQTRKYWFSGINALLLTIFTVGFATDLPFLLSIQAELTSKLHPFEGMLHQHQAVETILGINRLWLVDVSHDVSLATDSSMTPTWDSRQVITDRRKLTHLFRCLASDSVRDQVDLVVCDLTFGAVSDASQDRQLRRVITQLDSMGKLLIAQTQMVDNKEVGGSTVVNADSMNGGLVDITTYFDRQFYAYPLFSVTNSAKRRPSLAYAIYRHLRNIDTDMTKENQDTETDAKGIEWSIMSQFIPDYIVDDTDVMDNIDPISTELSKTTGRLVPYLYRLGELAALRVEGDSLSHKFDPEAISPLIKQLDTNHQKGLYNVVFIGLFDGNERDMHQTAVGPMHGSMILINALLNMLNGAHRITWPYILLLMVSFAGISWQFLRVEIGKLQDNEEQEQSKQPESHESIVKKMERVAEKLVKSLGKWLIDNQIYLLTLALLLIVMVMFNHLINIAVVEFYLAINTFLFKEFWLKE